MKDPGIHHRCKPIATFIIGLLLNGEAGFAQTGERETVTQHAGWFQVNSAVKLHKRFGLLLDGQFRFVQFESQQHMLRAGADLYLTRQLSVVPIGYLYNWNYAYGKQPTSSPGREQRLWQQVFYKHKIGKANVNHRLRMEERFLEAFSTDSNGEVTSIGFETYRNRLRYRFLLWAPLKGEEIVPGSYFWGGVFETFVSWGEGVTYHEPDQYRFHAAIGYQINKDAQFIAGPNYQLLIKKNGTQQENNIGLMVWFNYNFDFTRRED